MSVTLDSFIKRCIPDEAYLTFRDASVSLVGRDCHCVRGREQRKDREEDGRLHGCEGTVDLWRV